MRDDLLENMQLDSKAISITYFLVRSSISTAEIFYRSYLYNDADLLSTDNHRGT